MKEYQALSQDRLFNRDESTASFSERYTEKVMWLAQLVSNAFVTRSPQVRSLQSAWKIQQSFSTNNLFDKSRKQLMFDEVFWILAI